jgi:Zn-dependent protease/CBS domain-containing protein
MPPASPPPPWSFRIGTALGIPIRVHATLLLLVVWLASTAMAAGESALVATAFPILVLGCIVLHELGHAATAQVFGVKTRDIVLYPIGGVARLESMPSGTAELAIAVAGPLVNLVIGGLLFVVALVAGVPLVMPSAPTGSLVTNLIVANAMLFLFNLVPAFPMDGGRILRALLTLVLPEDRATQIAAGVGQVLALGFGVFAVATGQWLLLVIALFVFLGAAQEAAFTRGRAAVRGRTAREAMVTRFETLTPQDPISRGTALLLESHQHDFPVIDAWGRLAGLVTRPQLLEAFARQGGDTPVLDVMLREPPTVPPDAGLEQVLQLLQQAPGLPLLVVDEDRLLGMITVENLSELIELTRRAGRPG